MRGGFGGTGVRPIPAASGKFAADELAVALACSRWAAEKMLALAYDLAARLPLTAAALHDGRIDAYKAQLIAEATRVLDDAAAAAAEAMILSGIDGLTPGQLRVRIGRAVLKADPTAGRSAPRAGPEASPGAAVARRRRHRRVVRLQPAAR